ncbi:GtrA family protein [Mariprofundus sp. EBB-1]|uniref:GtrA family protein n=1 Tax=Mariprofundus sp. EBB-1 TaxID=2650971 RepID=UPI001379858B|nr:GtrA family protein [Mariprofundus sp. EBB-1]
MDMKDDAGRYGRLKAEVIRFALTGGLNTLLTIALYQLLVTFINPEISYAVSWLAGFAFIAIAYPKYVFRSATTGVRQIVLLALLYLLSFFLGLYLTSAFVALGMHARLAVFAVIAITSALNFIFSRLLFAGGKNYSAGSSER